MRGDFFIVLSFDKRNNHYYLEMYRYAQIPNIVDKQFLFESKERLEIQVELNEGRRLASILVEEYNMQTQKFMKNTMYLLNSSEFKVASTQSDTHIYRISAGMQAVTHDELPSRKPIYEYSRLFQKFMYDKKKTDLKVKLFFQYVDDKALSSAPTITSQRTHLSEGHLKYETFMFTIDPARLFRREPLPHLNTKSSNPFVGSLGQNDLKAVSDADENKVELVTDSRFFNKKLIGVFRMPKRVSICVYEDGTVQKNRIVDPAKTTHLVLPFPEATRAMITMLGTETPMLILQDKKGSTVGFIQSKNDWVRKFTIESGKYELQQSFGPFLVGVDLTDQTLKILELGGKEDNTIVTEYPFGRTGVRDFAVDAYYEKSNFAIKYEKGTVHFSWYKFD